MKASIRTKIAEMRYSFDVVRTHQPLKATFTMPLFRASFYDSFNL